LTEKQKQLFRQSHYATIDLQRRKHNEYDHEEVAKNETCLCIVHIYKLCRGSMVALYKLLERGMNMFRVLKMGSAFVGIIVGAGFASGQEILQYFTSFGYLGTIGAIVSTILFAYLGMTLTKVGSRMQTLSHKEAIYTISGRWLGLIVDAILVFTLFGVGVVMVAGAGSLLNQQFGLPVFLGSLILIVLMIITMLLQVNKVIGVIGSITPFLILAVVAAAIYSLFTMDTSFAELEPTALKQESEFGHWLIAAINYASFNIAVGAGMSIVMGAAEKNERIASLGGLVGGILIGVLIMLSHLAIFSLVDVVAAYDMPLLKIVDQIGPGLGIIFSIILFGMIFNTGVSMFYGFVVRFNDPGTTKFVVWSFIVSIAGFIASFVGFTDLVAKFYSLIGYLGVFLILALIYAPFKLKKMGK